MHIYLNCFPGNFFEVKGGNIINKSHVLFHNFKQVYEKQDLLGKLTDIHGYFNDFRLSEVHCIDLIGKIEDPNVTKLSEALDMTRGAISKMTKRMLEQNVITKYQKPDNKKEIYFALTDLGKEIYVKHEKAHKDYEKRDLEFFQQIKEEEQDIIIKFLEEFNHHLENKIKELDIYED
ncbi:MarR family transcriptional regulator [Clostridium sp. Marseille-QA1073]